MSRRAEHRHVFELRSFTRLSQQQTAAAHVTSADEVERKPKAVAEDRDEDVDVLRRGDAAEQDDIAVGAKLPVQHSRAPLERDGEERIPRMHVRFGKRLNVGGCHQHVGRAGGRRSA